MTGKGHGQPTRPKHSGGFKPGDRVVTPLGRYATIVSCRIDGYLNALYDAEHPTLADVILHPQTLRRVQ